MEPQVTTPRLMDSGAAFLRRPLASLQPIEMKRVACLLAGLVVVGFGALEAWRPYFFLADDNLCHLLPVFNEVGRNIFNGRPPFVSHCLFGGGYHFLADPSIIFLAHPFAILCSMLTQLGFKLSAIEVYMAIQIMLAAFSFLMLLLVLARHHECPVPVFASLWLPVSYAFSVHLLITGTCWANYSNIYAATPLVYAGLLHPRPRISVALVAAGLLHALFGSIHSFLFLCLVTSIFATVFCFRNRSARMWKVWFVGGAVAAAGALPVMSSAIATFLSIPRAGARSDACVHTIPAFSALSSFLSGGFNALHASDIQIQGLPVVAGNGMMFSMASFGALLALWKCNFRSPLVIATVAGVVAGLLLCCRDVTLGWYLSFLPLYRSLRWPFREVVFALFFIHLFTALFIHRVRLRAQVLAAVAGVALQVFTVGSAKHLALTDYTWDRPLVLSGRAQRYWDRLRKLVGPHALFVPAINYKEVGGVNPEIPYSLIGMYAYPALFDVPSISGYSTTRAPTKHWIAPRTGDGGELDPKYMPRVVEDPAIHVMLIHHLHPPVIWVMQQGVGHEVDWEKLADE